MDTTETPTLEQFVDVREMHQHVRQIFATVDSLRWFVRRHRAQLVQDQAMIVIAGRMRFNPKRFKESAINIGLRAAA